LALKTVNYEGKSFDISYEIVNPSLKEDIVILHGWASNKELMKQAFSPFLEKYRHIYIDMPGFGKSSNDYVLMTSDYAKIIQEFLNLLDSTPLVIGGHSYGGKVATLLNPKNLILLSSAGIVEEKSFDVKVKIVFAKILKSIGLGSFSKIFRSKDVNTMSENMYATFKNILNEDFSEHFASYKKNGMIFWGEKDTATSLASGKKIHELIENSSFKSYDGDHFFFLKFAQDICTEIENGIK
jgi:pimeloyl-ACP methyl ester carboxylesterase